MHIPDGYISPATALAFYGAVLPFWWAAGQRLKRVLTGQLVPALALFSAFTFAIMMFNIPVPGGTTAHAVGGTLAAVVLGPWAAIISVSVALIIQALFFGDGGITAIGANCFILGVALPLTGYGVYRLVSGRSDPLSRRRLLAAAIGAYVGINVAGLLVGLALGIQPIFWSENGRALYSPYGLREAVPAMLIPHLTIAGAAEVIATVFGLAYVQRAHPELLERRAATARVAPSARRLTLAIFVLLALFSPLGLLATGSAWGEWGSDELAQRVGYVPRGLEELESLWSAPLPDYTLPWMSETASFAEQALAYILSAIVGIALIFATAFALRILLRPRQGQQATAGG
uniref:Cobalt transporter CbiM n=2 Tax=Thermorudis TaxID=1649508 RepID=A0A831X059_9BACT